MFYSQVKAHAIEEFRWRRRGVVRGWRGRGQAAARGKGKHAPKEYLALRNWKHKKAPEELLAPALCLPPRPRHEPARRSLAANAATIGQRWRPAIDQQLRPARTPLHLAIAVRPAIDQQLRPARTPLHLASGCARHGRHYTWIATVITNLAANFPFPCFYGSTSLERVMHFTAGASPLRRVVATALCRRADLPCNPDAPRQSEAATARDVSQGESA